MKATELRIGNLVFIDLSGKPYAVDAIIRDGTPSDTHCGFELYVEGIDYDYAIYAEPIPLAEEWLARFRIRKERKDVYPIKDTGLQILIESNGVFTLCTRSVLSDYEEVVSSISYVHQLQNLYYALTGEELTVQQDNA